MRNVLSTRPAPFLLVLLLLPHLLELNLLIGGTLWAKASKEHNESSLPRLKPLVLYSEPLELLSRSSETTSRPWSLLELVASSPSPWTRFSIRVKAPLMGPLVGPTGVLKEVLSTPCSSTNKHDRVPDSKDPILIQDEELTITMERYWYIAAYGRWSL